MITIGDKFILIHILIFVTLIKTLSIQMTFHKLDNEFDNIIIFEQKAYYR